jgi:acetyl esterase/lipase
VGPSDRAKQRDRRPKNIKGWGADPARIAARDKQIPLPRSVIPVYPVAPASLDTPSKKDEAAAKPLNTPMMAWFFDKVLNSDSDKSDPRLNLVAADLKDLPPMTVINAQIDPLRSDGDMLNDKLTAAGNKVTHKTYDGVIHEFSGMAAVVAKAKEAQDFAVSQLQKGFGGLTTVGTAPPK